MSNAIAVKKIIEKNLKKFSRGLRKPTDKRLHPLGSSFRWKFPEPV
jgi:hypothetical protein